jgi:hypothetical protein
MMHAIDVLLDSFTMLFRHHRYFPLEKFYCSKGLGITYFHETFETGN